MMLSKQWKASMDKKIGSLEIDISLAKPPSENKKKEQRKREQERRMMRAYMYGDVDYFYSAPMSRGGRMGAAAGPRRTYADPYEDYYYSGYYEDDYGYGGMPPYMPMRGRGGRGGMPPMAAAGWRYNGAPWSGRNNARRGGAGARGGR